MAAGPELLTLEQLGKYSAMYQRGEISAQRLQWAKEHACPGCGACSFIGTASTMQIMAEALGLALPGSALLPAGSPELAECAARSGAQAVRLAAMPNMRPRDIVTVESFETQFWFMPQFQVLPIVCCTFRPLPTNTELQSPAIPSTACTAGLAIC